MDRLSRLIEKIHSASVDARAWPSVVRSIQAHFHGASAGIYGATPEEGEARLLHLADIDPAYVNQYIDRFLPNNPWLRVERLQEPGVIRTDRSLDEHYNDPGYYRRTTLYNEWMNPQGFIYSLGATLSEHSGVRTKLYVYRNRREGAFAHEQVRAFTVVTRHLMTAVAVARRLASTDRLLRGAFEATERLRTGVVLLDEAGRILHANRCARRLFRDRDGLRAAGRVATTAHSNDRTVLERCFARALDLRSRRSLAEPMNISLRRPSGKRDLRAIAIPVAAARHPFGESGAAVALVVNDPDDARPAFSLKELRARYSLTHAEARLTRNVVRGVALREAAAQSGLSYQTARGYLKSVFEKTHTSRQAELVNRLFSDQLPFDSAD